MDRTTRRALEGWCWAVTLFGLALTGAAFEATDGFARWAFALLGWPQISWTPPLRFAVALMGAVTLGWGVTLRAAVGVAEPGAGPLWRRILVAAVIWYAVDSSLSVATGFALNAASNTLILAALVVILRRGGAMGVEPGPRTVDA